LSGPRRSGKRTARGNLRSTPAGRRCALVALIVAITVVAVGGAKCVYAVLAGQVKARMKPGMSRVLNRLAAVIMIAAGIAVALRT